MILIFKKIFHFELVMKLLKRKIFSETLNVIFEKCKKEFNRERIKIFSAKHLEHFLYINVYVFKQ